MYLCKGDYIFALEALSSAYTVLVVLFESQFSQVFDESYEDVLRVVLFKGQVWVAGGLFLVFVALSKVGDGARGQGTKSVVVR